MTFIHIIIINRSKEHQKLNLYWKQFVQLLVGTFFEGAGQFMLFYIVDIAIDKQQQQKIPK